MRPFIPFSSYLAFRPASKLFGRRRMATKSYKNAIELLNSLQSNAATLEAVRASGGRLSEFAIPEMIEYLQRIGYNVEDLNVLNVAHITGTKGKGSTSAFTDSILRRARPDWKIGLYTSPHLIAVRERIRINGAPISEDDFTRYFFDVWERLEKNNIRKLSSTTIMPGYFRFITLVAFHAFLDMKVDATILEVGVGGKYDSTNIVPKPVVTAVTALGIDHTAKGGIFKAGVPALTVNQPEEGLKVLEQQAKDLEASEFNVTQIIPGLPDIKLGLAGIHQVQNANLAVHISHLFLQSQTTWKSDDLLPSSFVEGLQLARWPGRCQTVVDPKHQSVGWYLDGAHTVESLDCCFQWFVSPGVGLPADVNPARILIFNCTNGRSGTAFLGAAHAKIAAQLRLHQEHAAPATFFDHVIFCTNVTYADGGFKGDLTTLAIPVDDLAELKTQQQLASTWSALIPSFPQSNIHVLPSIEHAVRQVRKVESEASQPVQVLVTGSLHLIGGLIEVAGLSELAL
ncbi:Mur ligase [Infundibulicybe gibba]|nr:Mur ligase [Infundibulicybe gibba]